MSVRPGRAIAGLTIAGTDSSGGAGVTADVRTFAAFGIWPACAITAVTAQRVGGVDRVVAVDPDMVTAQIGAATSSLDVRVAKTGMLPTAACIEAVATCWAGQPRRIPLVVDPVLLASSGEALSEASARSVLVRALLPYATVITPNLDEAGWLLGCDPPSSRGGMVEAARALLALGPAAVLLTGGHLEGPEAADVLVFAGAEPRWLLAPRIDTKSTHGTGCVLSAAIAAGLANGEPTAAAVEAAKRFITRALHGGIVLDDAGSGAPDPSA